MIDQAVDGERPFFRIDGGFAVRGHEIKIIVGRNGAKGGQRAIVEVGVHVGIARVHALHHVTIGGDGKKQADPRSRSHGEESAPVHSSRTSEPCSYCLAAEAKWEAEGWG